MCYNHSLMHAAEHPWSDSSLVQCQDMHARQPAVSSMSSHTVMAAWTCIIKHVKAYIYEGLDTLCQAVELLCLLMQADAQTLGVLLLIQDILVHDDRDQQRPCHIVSTVRRPQTIEVGSSSKHFMHCAVCCVWSECSVADQQCCKYLSSI